MSGSLLSGIPRRAAILMLVALAAFLAAPWFANDYLLTVLILILYFAYTGQAWNIMMGFAGQLSLGHALYVGLGAYAAAALFAFFKFSLTGKAIRACADNYLGARVVGLNVKKLYALTFGLGSICVAVAGCALVLLVDVTPGLGPAYTLLAFVIVIVGGLGSMPGALLGGILIGVSEALAGLFIAPSAKSMFSFGLLILVLLFRPQGLLGKKS